MEDNDMGGNGVEDNGTDDTTMGDYLAEDASLRGTIRRHFESTGMAGGRTEPKKQRRRTGQQEPEARDISVIMQIRESEAKTGEVELETREAGLKDRQVAMLIKLDEQERDYTLCDLSPTYQPAERMSTVLEEVWGSWLGISSSCLSWVTKVPDRLFRLARQHQAMLLFLQQKSS
jgi:hypothetical protein